MKKTFEFLFFTENDRIDFSQIPFSRFTSVLQLDANIHKSNECDFYDNNGEHITNVNQYGTVAGLYWLWKNNTKDYIGFSLGTVYPYLTENEIQTLINSNRTACVIKSNKLSCNLRENYRSLYYDFDMMLCMDVLKLSNPIMYEYAYNQVIMKDDFILPSVIMRKDVFRKFCLWLFPILERCEKECETKKSKFQNRFLEHLTYYLLTIYLKYHKDKLNYLEVDKEAYAVRIAANTEEVIMESMASKINNLYADGEVERIVEILAQNENDDSLKRYREIFNEYKREKRYYKSTLIDNLDSLDEIYERLQTKKKLKSKKTRRILIFKWNSFTNDDTFRGFEELGFECDYIQISDLRYARRNDSIDIINTYLNKNSYDLAFSVNYIEALSEACYVHGIPYIAWAYDSPTDLGEPSYLRYDTTHVFLFDSSEMYSYSDIQKIPNVKYMPLAADTNKYDSIEISGEDIKKYKAQISFVGQLYDNKLSDYMQYLDDYHKAYINAVIDYSIGKYNCRTLDGLVTAKFVDEFMTKKFVNAIVKGENEANITLDNIPEVVGRFSLLLNKSVTNRERLILISMLSKHWDFRLYSNSSHEVMTNTKEMGLIDYKEGMPKVFKLSDINLNISLHTIKTGIPQRCIDIMGCNAFLLSNYQKDFDEYFVDGESVALFHSLEEAYEKCKFYMEHEEVRKKIARSGYEIVKNNFSYVTQTKKMILESGLAYLLE